MGDALGRDHPALRVVEHVREDGLGEVDGDGHAAHAGVGDDPIQGALELADVADDLAGDELEHVRRDGHAVLLRLGAQDGDARLEVGRREVGDQAPLEAAAQALLEGQ